MQEEEQKVEKKYRLKSSSQMIKFKSLNRNKDFLKILKKKKLNTKYYTIYFDKNSNNPNNVLNISFVMKKKIGNAVKRNKIRRKLKAIVQKLLKKRGAISKDYTYIVFGKSNAYLQKQSTLMPLMEKSFNTLKNK